MRLRKKALSLCQLALANRCNIWYSSPDKYTFTSKSLLIFAIKILNKKGYLVAQCLLCNSISFCPTSNRGLFVCPFFKKLTADWVIPKFDAISTWFNPFNLRSFINFLMSKRKYFNCLKVYFIRKIIKSQNKIVFIIQNYILFIKIIKTINIKKIKKTKKYK